MTVRGKLRPGAGIGRLPIVGALAPAAPTGRARHSRELLLQAAVAQFSRDGYYSTSIDSIASAASVSRMTFYRHFRGKTGILVELFQRAVGGAMPHLARLCHIDVRDEATVKQWIAELFAADRQQRALLHIFSQASRADPDFAARANKMIDDVIALFGETIPAFTFASPADPATRKRYLESWLLLYDLFDQSNQAAVGTGVASDPLVIEILAERLFRFISAGPADDGSPARVS